MKKTLGMVLAGLVAVSAMVVPAVRAEQAEGKQIMKKSLDAMKVSGLESVAMLVIKDDKGNQRVRKFTSAAKEYKAEGVKKSIMRFLEPADVKGTGFLTYEYDQANKDNDMWLYMPALRKTRRIVSSEKSKSFMGSEFSNADITSPKLDDYQYKMLADEKVGDVDCWKIESVPTNDRVLEDYGYSKKVSWIGKGDYVARKNEFYDREGKLVKVLTVDKVTVLDKAKNLYQAADTTIKNVQKNRSSQFIIQKSALNPNIKDSIFTTDYLQK